MSRVVIIIGSVAVKFPKIRIVFVFKQCLKVLYKSDRKDRLSHLVVTLFSSPWMYGTTAFFLFRGMAENWQEFCFWKKNRFKFLAPTHFSFFGFVNFQKAGIPYHKDDIWPRLLKWNYTMAFKDAHTFGEPKNFCWVDGMAKIVDYGSDRSREVLLNYGKNNESF